MRFKESKILSTTDDFKKISESISELCILSGVSVAPYLNPKLKFFSRLNFETQNSVNENLKKQFEIYNAAFVKGVDLKKTAQLSWEALRRLNLVPSHDFFDKISDSNFLEFYDLNLIQIFRDINFYGI
ncbi:MAG TPA: hypothetical protein PLJ21_11435, partial [Pseudobdellovibrionaceae bacterium]|nr:hypothetical protein [Pseudobdellovibrionaceae bacterium]